MGKRTNRLKWMMVALCIAAASVFFVSCSKPSVQGLIFLDENGNKLYDLGEKKLGNVIYEVYIDDKPVRSSMSYQDGFYEEELEKKGIQKNVCIKVDIDRTPPTQIFESIGVVPGETASGGETAPAVAKAGTIGPKALETTDTDGDGVADSIDTDDDGDGVADASDNCPLKKNSNQSDQDKDKIGDLCDNCPKKANKDQKNVDDDDYGDACDACPDDPLNECDKKDSEDGESGGGGSGSSSSDDADTSDARLEFNEICVDVDEIHRKPLDRDIPIAIEYSENIFDINKQEVSVMPGKSSKVWVTYSCSCKLEKFCLPSWLHEGVWKGKDFGMACINLAQNKEVYPEIMAFAPESPVEDENCKQEFDIAADPALSEEKTDVIKIKASCPDGNDQDIEITVKGYPESPIDVIPSLQTPLAEIEPEVPIKVRYSIKNKSNAPFKNVELSVGLINNVDVNPYPPLMVSNVSDPTNCSNMGASVTCVVKNLKTGDAVPAAFFDITFQGPKNDRFGEYITKATVVLKDIIPPLSIDVNNDLGSKDMPRAVLLNIPELEDTDDDGIPDKTDNCIFVENEDQKDTDGDNDGDACDDDDSDGVPFSIDNCPDAKNADQIDGDNDGYGKGCDSDDDDDTKH